MFAAALALSVVMGVTLGLMGGGGSILTVPILLFVLGLDAKVAIATSLFVVGTTSIVGTIQHARAGNVRWRIGLVFGLVAMVGSYGGGIAASYFSGTILLILFGFMMIAAAVAMLRKKKDPPKNVTPSTWKIAVDGLVVGVFTGLVGAGGGFLVVPALVLFGGVPMHAAVGTSLMVIVLKSFSALAGHLQHVSIDFGQAGAIAGAAVVGALLGGRFANRIEAGTLRRWFAYFVLVMAVVVLYPQIKSL